MGHPTLEAPGVLPSTPGAQMATHTGIRPDDDAHVRCTVSLSVFAGPEQILRRLYVFAEEPCKSTITTSEPFSPVFKEAQPRPSKQSISLISRI